MLTSGNDNSKVIIPIGGAVASFPLGEEIEYGTNGNLPATLVEHGRLSQDGVKISPTTTQQTINGWPYTDVVATFISDSSLTFNMTLLQAEQDDNLELYFSTKKNSVTGGYHFNAGKAAQKRSWVIDAIDETNNTKTRWYFPEANVTERGEISINAQGLIELPLTFTAYSKEIEGETSSLIFWKAPLTANS